VPLSDQDKLNDLTSSEGYDSVDEMIEAIRTDSIVPGVCMNAGCHFTTGVAPDEDHGYCERCGTRTVKSALRLRGIV
jgi:hypothetical protein